MFFNIVFFYYIFYLYYKYLFFTDFLVRDFSSPAASSSEKISGRNPRIILGRALPSPGRSKAAVEPVTFVNCYIFGFDSLFDSLRPINNLSVKQGRAFLG